MSRRFSVTAAAVLALVVVLATTTGCSSGGTSMGVSATANLQTCGGEDCHSEAVVAMGAGRHVALTCYACHANATAEHGENPSEVTAGIDWRIDACAECHKGEALTYLYDDNAKAGVFGGSQREPAQPKTDTFPEYNTIVAGHGFTKEYNEEGAHAFMLEDHYEITRTKYETCMQCKSTKVAYAWDSGKTLKLEADTDIQLTHAATETSPNVTVTIPAGTEVSWATDPKTREVDAKATFPDGTVYTSRPSKSEDATMSFNMLWATTVAVTNETWPYGAGCNHCHDPHTAEMRLVRKALIGSIEAKGVNPYADTLVKDFGNASARDQRVLTCAQCHVEYTCGKSGVDGVDRDAYGWSKARGLHDLYTQQFDYAQDWRHAIIGEPLIKSQHPETELYWESPHYNAGAACGDCHMPEVSLDNETFRSHWFTSPYKYGNAELAGKFASATGITPRSVSNPCTRCHSDRTERAIGQQQAFFALQARVEQLLAQSVRRLGALGQEQRAGTNYKTALTSHRQAHVIWENLAVSENSMGFHNFEESMRAMAEAESSVLTAIELEKRMSKK